MMITLYVIYGLILIGGGIMGYAKAKSQASLISGITTGALALAGAALYGSRHDTVRLAEAALAIIVAVLFIVRYTKTKKAMPAIPVIVLSAIVIAASFVPVVRR
ncbi:hypothetical protein CCAX7_20380 [Capsulimonas corticalis]|uniref:Uncharacterized protein n=1 Tax=Capsulimonas corticalis TaxID=2219043 RepID=A0A402D2E8_9BACT|nr:TMEM14 family protein [Capsulimonas corticalis]BDI29987.1 hypothetical protein CCAX7_20380 [Capsulimonas corticalis]